MLGKPIWIDEIVQMAFGAFDSYLEAWKIFVETSGGVNHGQTGTYYMADYWLTKVFGANTFWLRFPSLISGFLLFFASIKLFRLWGFSFFWQILGILALFNQTWFSEFIGEARPYMPLAAASMGTLAYYLAPSPLRHDSSTKVLGYVSVLWGSLFHPYFILYWFSAITLGVFFEKYKNPSPPPTHRIINVPLISIGLTVYFGLGILTWISHPVHLNRDPFMFLPKDISVARYLFGNHFLFLKKLKAPLVIAWLAFGLGSIYVQRLKNLRRQICFSVIIILVGLGISGVLSYISYRNRYWILERQWIASVGWTTVGSMWFLQTIFQTWTDGKSHLKKTKKILFFGFSCFLILNSVFLAKSRTEKSIHWLKYAHKEADFTLELQEVPSEGGVNYWEKLARSNCAKGGPVWKQFQKMYRP